MEPIAWTTFAPQSCTAPATDRRRVTSRPRPAPFLDPVRYADSIGSVFGAGPARARLPRPESWNGLVKLYHATGNARHLP